MKRIVWTIMVVFALSCSKSKDSTTSDIINTDESDITEFIYESTGCIPEDAESITRFELFKDIEGEKYLYGSKQKNGKEYFWMAKYSSSGKELWDIEKTDANYNSYANSPVNLSNGNIFILYTITPSITEVLNSSPVIVNMKGNATFLDVFDENYICTDIAVFEDFFFTYVSEKELDVLPHAINRAAQISNSGKIIRRFDNGTNDITLPNKDEYVFCISDSTYAAISEKMIEGHSFAKSISFQSWEFPVELPAYQSCDMNLSMVDTVLVAYYYLKYNDGVNDTISYSLSPNVGKELIALEGISFSQTEITIIQGNTFTLSTIFTPENAFNKHLTWESSNESIATISQEGIVTAISTGQCVITAIADDGGYKAICQITVREQTIEDLISARIISSAIISVGGYITGSVTLQFYNNSDKEVKVTSLKIYDTSTNKEIYKDGNVTNVGAKESKQYNLNIQNVYKPLYIWTYECEGISYEVSCQS